MLEKRFPEDRRGAGADRCEISSAARCWNSFLATGGAPPAGVRRQSPVEAMALSRRIVEQHLREG